MGEAPTTASPRRQWRRRLLIALLLLAAPALLAVGWHQARRWRLQAELDAELAALDRADPGWRLDDLLRARPALPEAEDAGPVALRAARAIPKPWPSDQTLQSNTLADEEATTDRLLRPNALFLLTKDLAAAAEAERLAAPLDRFSRGRFPVRPPGVNWLASFEPHLSEARALVELLRWRAFVQLGSGDLTGAARQIRRLHAVWRCFDDEATLFSQLTRLSIRGHAVRLVQRILGQGELPDPELAALQKLLVDDAAHPGFKLGIRGERAGLDRMMAGFADGTAPNYAAATHQLQRTNIASLTGVDAIDRRLQKWWERMPVSPVERERVLLLRSQTEALALTDLPEPERPAAFIARADRTQGLFAKMLVTGDAKLCVSHLKEEARLRSAIAGLAAERFRLREKRWPERWEELVPDFLPAVPNDPFAGGPMLLKRLPDGLAIYSVGYDRKDDGGAVIERLDRAGSKIQPVDAGFQLFDPASRGKPPLPAPLFDDMWEKLRDALPLPG